MAEKKTSPLLWIGLAGVAGILIYEWWKGQQAAAPAATTTTPTASTATTELPSGVETSVMTPTQLTTQQVAPSTTAPAGIDPSVYATVQQWGLGDGRGPVLAMLAANVPAEYQGMYNLIVNYWDAGVQPSADAITFWNNLRTEYDPTHQSW